MGRRRAAGALWALLFAAAAAAVCGALSAERLSDAERVWCREKVRQMFTFAYDSYKRCAFPRDELRPLTCEGRDAPIAGGHALTLLDSLDALVIFGNVSEFRRAVEWIDANLRFDTDVTVSVFEMNIRALGGLLSGHLLASDASLGLMSSYNGSLLRLAEDLGRRLLPAFDTPTGIPYGSVNLRSGVPPGETPVTSVAGGGTYVLEFGLLSRLVGNPVYEDVARAALRGVFQRRSALGLVGNHINVITGDWTHSDSGVGAGIDSYYEYMYKGAVMFGDMEYLDMFHKSVNAVQQHVYRDPYYLEVGMANGVVTWPVANSLAAFWPGVLAMAGDTETASRSLRALLKVWRRFGCYPEGFDINTNAPHPGQRGYPLRPELIESTYHLFRSTGDSRWLRHGREFIHSLEFVARAPFGYAAIVDVETRQQRNVMDSFFLSETLKYLYLLFDDANIVNEGFGRYVFNTEGHIFPLAAVVETPSNATLLATVSHLRGRCGASRVKSLLSVDGFRFPDSEADSLHSSTCAVDVSG